MKQLLKFIGLALFTAAFSSPALGGDDVGASFVKEADGNHKVEMAGSLTENNLSCKADAKQPCQKLFDTTHDSAAQSFAGTISGEILDPDGRTRQATFALGTLYLKGAEHRIIFELDEATNEIGMIWVDPAAGIDTEIRLPTDGL